MKKYKPIELEIMKRLLPLSRAIALFLLFGLPSTILSPFLGYVQTQMRRLRRRNQRIENVIFDLGGVLLNNSKKKAFLTIGISRFFAYIATLHNPFNVQKKLFNFLHTIKPLDPTIPKSYSPDGKHILPQLLIDWLSGTYSCSQIRGIVSSHVKSHPNSFKDRSERSLILSMALMIFTPKAIAASVYPTKKGIKFVKTCKEKGLNVYILSNFDAESFELIQKKHPELFGLFEKENIFVSGYHKTAKPALPFYQILLNNSNICPESCLLFDDQTENIKAAQQLGIQGIVCKKRKNLFSSELHFQTLEKQLNDLLEKQNKDLTYEIL